LHIISGTAERDQLQGWGVAMTEFHAAMVEVFSEQEGVVTIHFDDQASHYLQLQVPEVDDPVEYEKGYGNVYVEIDDQLYSGFNCFSLAELKRRSFRLVLDRDKELLKIGEVRVTFEIDDAAFEQLRRALVLAFRAFGNFHVSADE
jgi:hypothetical protein